MKTEQDYPRCYAKIDLDAVLHNMGQIYDALQPNTKVIAVVKTDAYGHGAVAIAKAIKDLPFLWGFAVATVKEGAILRRHGIKNPILILSLSYREELGEIVAWDLQPTMVSYARVRDLSTIARKLGKEVSIHIKIDTGMSRIGYQVQKESADEIVKIAQLPNIKVEGVYTHFAKADEADKTHVNGQILLFQRMLSMLEERNIQIPLRHCSNSAGIIDLPKANMDAVRAGIILYGLMPSDEVDQTRLQLNPVLSLKSQICYLKTLNPGRTISYGGTYEVMEPKKIATIPIGYGDGYPRSLSNKGYVLIHGQKAPICGRVCMDQFMVDVTQIASIQEGDEVTLIGTDGEETITLDDLAKLSGKFNYEFACGLGQRIPRVFYQGGEIVGVKDNFDE